MFEMRSSNWSSGSKSVGVFAWRRIDRDAAVRGWRMAITIAPPIWVSLGRTTEGIGGGLETLLNGGRVRLADDAYAAGQARRYARSWANLQSLSAQGVAELELVVSELVSNAVRHGTPLYDLELSRSDSAVRGVVQDHSIQPPQRHPKPDEHGGFG
jgi:hypothetical protein